MVFAEKQSIGLTAGHTMSHMSTSLQSPFAVYVHWRLQGPTSHLLNIGTGLSSKPASENQIFNEHKKRN